MKQLQFDSTNAICGLTFIGLGGFFIYQCLDLDLGTAFRMGPGYFPLILAAILTLLGVVVLVQATRVQGEPMGPLALRGMLFILPAPVFFGLTVRGLGFVPSLFFAALIAAFASSRMKPFLAVLLAGAITLFSVLVFSYALGLPFERFGPWTRL
ncbi:tripartite tricarboxylate transporter TctB family protein [Shinella yambaruensis]|uniref:Membrane protein n=1 Tax=Shinella yambaruensis TaxID=415996 RepID=A0ABQ5ZH79_9HYPH|nr:tripartite tricarboxylate transporter TctB family protein [Shinella yambaruensis]MCJ8024691.1 tripartite tricarboxylate transporter TctB family protein [Shinella yambaruensis]MCU7979144.1 tripartite tricarboxylate transporter TctB family protein [Shinella yambaruensis]GLR50971.1 membrane protein [Shinella yambaruensis]